MIFTETRLQDAYVIELERREDERGFFARAWCRHEFADHGLSSELAQCNVSFNRFRGTLRGLHFQVAPHAEVKLVRCTRGAVYDVIVDLRPGSPTFMQWVGIELTAENRRTLYVPEGFAHGYQTLEDATEVFYLASDVYAPEYADGLRWDDPAFRIEWPATDGVTITERDRTYPDFDPRRV